MDGYGRFIHKNGDYYVCNYKLISKENLRLELKRDLVHLHIMMILTMKANGLITKRYLMLLI